MHMIILFLLILLSPNFASETGGPVEWTESPMHAAAGVGAPSPSSPEEAAHPGGTVAVPTVAAGPTTPHPDDAALTPGVPTRRYYPPGFITFDFHLYMCPGKVATEYCLDPGPAEKLVVGTPDDQLRIRNLDVTVSADLGFFLLAKAVPFESMWEAERRRSEGIADPEHDLVVFRITNDGAKLRLNLDKSAGSRTDYLVDCSKCATPPEIVLYTQKRSWPGTFPRHNCQFIGPFSSLTMRVLLQDAEGSIVDPHKGVVELLKFTPPEEEA